MRLYIHGHDCRCRFASVTKGSVTLAVDVKPIVEDMMKAIGQMNVIGLPEEEIRYRRDLLQQMLDQLRGSMRWALETPVEKVVDTLYPLPHKRELRAMADPHDDGIRWRVDPSAGVEKAGQLQRSIDGGPWHPDVATATAQRTSLWHSLYGMPYETLTEG